MAESQLKLSSQPKISVHSETSGKIFARESEKVLITMTNKLRIGLEACWENHHAPSTSTTLLLVILDLVICAFDCTVGSV